MDDPAEEFEHIPWAQLGAEHQAGRNRLLYVAAGALVALALGAVAARSLWTPSVAPVPVAEALPLDETVAATTAAPTQPTPATAVLPAPALLSEADLMAGVPDRDAAAAAARAEWFVADFFTADLDPLGSLPVRTAIPAGGVPTLPQDGGAAGVTYVEWARAYRVDVVEAGLYRVAVAFRAVGAAGDDPFFRFPVRAVEVVVAVSADGRGLAVVDLPSPAALPLDVGFAAWPVHEAPVPDIVAAAAVAAAADWGGEPALVSGAATAQGWRVVVSVADDVGNRWPLSLWLDDAGRPLQVPPWESLG